MRLPHQVFVAICLAAALASLGCAQRAETAGTPESGTEDAARPETAPGEADAVQLEPAYPEDVSAEGLSAADEEQHRKAGEHSHDGSTHSHDGDDGGHGDDEHDDGHSH